MGATAPAASPPHLAAAKRLFELLAKSDGRDKFLATLQYLALYASAGEAGAALTKVAGNLGSSRKPFRVLKPLEIIIPLIYGPPGGWPKNTTITTINKLKLLGFLCYFMGDHVVWATSVGLLKDAEMAKTAGKVSMYGWMSSSVMTLAAELIAVAKTEKDAARAKRDRSVEKSAADKRTASEALWEKRNKHMLVISQNVALVGVAAGVLQLLPLKPRTIGALGVYGSLCNLYQMLPAPPVAAKPSLKEG